MHDLLSQNVICHRGVRVRDALRDALRISYTRREIRVHLTMHYVARPEKTMGFQFQEVESIMQI